LSVRIPVSGDSTESVSLGASEQIPMPLAGDLVNPRVKHVLSTSSRRYRLQRSRSYLPRLDIERASVRVSDRMGRSSRDVENASPASTQS